MWASACSLWPPLLSHVRCPSVPSIISVHNRYSVFISNYIFSLPVCAPVLMLLTDCMLMIINSFTQFQFVLKMPLWSYNWHNKLHMFELETHEIITMSKQWTYSYIWRTVPCVSLCPIVTTPFQLFLPALGPFHPPANDWSAFCHYRFSVTIDYITLHFLGLDVLFLVWLLSLIITEIQPYL